MAKRKSPVKIELSNADMTKISSWFLGYELGNAQLIERECRRIMNKNWKYERIISTFKAGKIGSTEFREFLEAATLHMRESMSLRNRLWSAFEEGQPRRKKRKR